MSSSLKDLGFTRDQLKATFHYLFGGISNKEFRSFFENGIYAKSLVDSSGYVLLNCKLFAWAHTQGYKPKAAAYKVSKEDARFLRRLDLSFVQGSYPVWELGEFRKAVEEQVWSKDLDVYIGKFISKKLLFLRSYGVYRPDIEAEMRMGALYSIYRVFPRFKSIVHIRNVAKRSVKNTGQSLIYKHTRQSRQALRSDGRGGYENLVLSLEFLLEQRVPMPTTAQAFDVTRSMQRLGEAYGKCTGRAQHFIALLMGQPDKEFSRFLGCRNDVAFAKMEFEAYCARVQSHLGISDKQTRKFFAKIRRI